MSVEKELNKALSKVQRISSYVPIIRDIVDVCIGIIIGIYNVYKDSAVNFKERQDIKNFISANTIEVKDDEK